MIAPRLKVASMTLFWFGIFFLFFILLGSALEYNKTQTFSGLNIPLISTFGPIGVIWMIYVLFMHVAHVVSGFLISKGGRGGIIIGLIVGFYEIVAFLIPSPDPVLFTLHGIGIRILFAFVIFLLISGRKELTSLQSARWRPWKNPMTN